jgi:hypothetical protein
LRLTSDLQDSPAQAWARILASLCSLSRKGIASQMASTIAGYQMIANNLDRSLERTAEKPDVQRDTTYYLAHIGDVKTADQFINNSRLFSYAMKAFGLLPRHSCARY